MSQYNVKTIDRPVDCVVSVPGSKSITNRALLMAALSDGECRLDGVLFSDDSRHFLECLISLGYEVAIDEPGKNVTIHGTSGDIPNKSGTINVGSAGTAARFLTAMLALSDGVYVIDSSEQMKKRPMKPLFDGLAAMGAHFEYIENEGFLPVKVTGAAYNGAVPACDVDIDISRSTQFLSALMMVAPVLKNGLNIHITSEKTDGSYIRITAKMMEQFGCHVKHEGALYVIGADERYSTSALMSESCGLQYMKSEVKGAANESMAVGDEAATNRTAVNSMAVGERAGGSLGVYNVEPDVSAACYFYAAAAITGGTAIVRGVHMDSMQGDVRFIQLLAKLGCEVTDTEQGIRVVGCKDGIYDGIDVDMNDFSDQSMTLAVVAAFARTQTYISNIGHIRLQESDRLHGIATELSRLGCKVDEEESAIRIYPSALHGGVVSTYEDHRMAMAFALIGLRVPGIVIDGCECCKKTFENYFEVLESIL